MGFEVGQRVADYEIVSLLGVGGMGRVYRVRNVISHRTEAMKVLLADLQAEPDLAARFVSEIRTLAGLDHPNIAQLHTALQTSNELVMMMEFVDGSTLQQLATHAPLRQEKVVEYMHQVLAALNFAHGHGVVHRDIKPANIMVTAQGTVKLTDFGIAKSTAEDELTRPGTTVGSLYYMSPEQARGGRFVDGRSDIYSVGITLYELLAGRRPFEDESAYVVLHNQLNVEPRPPIDVNPELSRPLSDLILKALEKDPERRFQSVADLSDALSRATGIAPATPIKCSGVFTSAVAKELAAASRSKSLAAGTARFSITTQRSSWVAAQALAVIALLGSAALGLPHLLRSGTSVKTAGPSVTPAVSFPVLPIHATNLAVATENAVAAQQVSAKQGMISAEPATAMVRAVIARPMQRARGAAAKLSRITFASAAQPGEASPIDEDNIISAPEFRSTGVRSERERTSALDARAGAVRISVQRLKTQTEADGASLSQYAAVVYVRMNAFLDGEKTALEEGDVAAAREQLSKAEFQASILQNLLSK